MNPGSICAYCIHFPVSNNYIPTAIACDFVWKYFIYHVRRTVQLFGIKLNHEISIIANYLHTRLRLNNLRVLSVTNKITISHPYLCLTSYSWLYLKIIRVIQARGNYNMFRDKKYSIFFSGVRTQRQQSLSLIIIYGILSIKYLDNCVFGTTSGQIFKRAIVFDLWSFWWTKCLMWFDFFAMASG